MNTPDTSWHPAFLLALGLTCNVRMACQQANVTRSIAYEHRAKAIEAREHEDTTSPFYGFDQKWDDALEDALDRLEYSLYARGQKKDTTAAIFLLKARRRDVFGDVSRIEHANADGKPFETSTTIRNQADEELAAWREQQKQSLAQFTTPPSATDER